ncbi:hypothetical protein [Flavobacterium cerinum]|uniref:Uncharacterized protein n=1 Tax=Flavobacterium cerinum TaxID=2502784 RepID=A0A3S3SFA7_9FLAO|nr:hypothetical protein [Flavobacterium cerinum]RWX00934.1 hypothetical protein EPI11_07890 [Flavobacterium cerinum]
MAINEKDFKAIERILNYVIKANIEPVQKYDAIDEYRPLKMIAKDLKYKDDDYCSEIYVNLHQLTDWQKKTFLMRAAKALPNRCYIEEYKDAKIIRIGFK